MRTGEQKELPVKPRRMAPAATAMASLREVDSALAETSTCCLAGLATLTLRALTCKFKVTKIIKRSKESWGKSGTRADSVGGEMGAYQRDLDKS